MWNDLRRHDSEVSIERVRLLEIARARTGIENMGMADALDWYEERVGPFAIDPGAAVAR